MTAAPAPRSVLTGGAAARTGGTGGTGGLGGTDPSEAQTTVPATVEQVVVVLAAAAAPGSPVLMPRSAIKARHGRGGTGGAGGDAGNGLYGDTMPAVLAVRDRRPWRWRRKSGTDNSTNRVSPEAPVAGGLGGSVARLGPGFREPSGPAQWRRRGSAAPEVPAAQAEPRPQEPVGGGHRGGAGGRGARVGPVKGGTGGAAGAGMAPAGPVELAVAAPEGTGTDNSGGRTAGWNRKMEWEWKEWKGSGSERWSRRRPEAARGGSGG